MRDCTDGKVAWGGPLAEDSLAETTAVLRALGNPLRLQMVLLMLEHVELDVRTLQREISVLTQSAISQHLAVLRQAGIVQTRTNGTFRHYSVQDDRTIKLLEVLGLSNDPSMALEDAHTGS